jgi:hypothetical protein
VENFDIAVFTSLVARNVTAAGDSVSRRIQTGVIGTDILVSVLSLVTTRDIHRASKA